ncbi:MAG: CoA transferase [Actinomycetota bacterium]
MSSPYAGIRVVDLWGGLSAGYATKMLTDGGADVVIVEPPTGDPLRAWRIGGATDDGPLFRYLRHGQRSTLDAEAAMAGADVVIIGRDGPDPEVLRAADPGLVVASITPYGRTGPYADRPATEFTMQCDVGSTAFRGLLWQEPFQAGGRTGEWFAGACAAVAIAGALRRQRLSGHGDTIDLAVAECINLAMTMFTDLWSSFNDREPIGKVPRNQETPSIEPTKDGWVGFNTNTRQQLGDFCLMAGRPEDADRFATARDRMVQWDDWNELVHDYTTAHTTAEIIEFASMLRIPVAPIGNGRDTPQIDQFVERGVFIDDPTGEFRMPRRPWRMNGEPLPDPRPAPSLDQGAPATTTDRPAPSDDAALPLAGLRVVDATAWWAGPTAGAVLAALGADVIHVESCTRPDGMRMTGGQFQHRDRWWEWSQLFQGANTNKRGLTLDLATDEGRSLFLRLAETADVVVENYTPRVFENFGFDRDTLAAQNPALIFARMPAFGLDGPWRDRPGFAQTMEQVTGLAWVTGHCDDQPRIQRGPCDPNAGMHAVFAIFGALIERDRTGQGAFLELTMVEAALNVAAEQVIEWTAHGHLIERNGNRSSYAAPQGIYRTDADETWVGVAVESDAQWEALVDVIGRPDLAQLDASGRRDRHDEIDAAIAAWSEVQSDEAAAETLVAAGVPAGIVRNPQRGDLHPQLAHRGYFESVDHPVTGTHPIAGMPWRSDTVERWIRVPPPTLGQHNREVLSELGLSPAEIDELESAGVIGETLIQ